MNSLTPNRNFLQKVNFKLTIDGDNTTNITFFAVNVAIPAVSSQEVTTQFRGQMGYQPGETLNFDALTLKFVVDEDMTNYLEVLNWLKSNTSGGKIPQTRKDITLSILSSKNTRNRQIRFKSAFPTSLSQIEFATIATDIEYAMVDVSFRYDGFELI